MKNYNLEVFLNTVEIIDNDKELSDLTYDSMQKSKLYKENFITDLVSPELQGNIKVINQRTLQNISQYDNLAILNFASATNPGGGVTRGANAQEESICRITNLYFCLNQEKFIKEFYEYHKSLRSGKYTDRIIYSPNIVMIKSDNKNSNILQKKDRIFFDVITCAAPNLNSVNLTEKELLLLLKQRIKNILNVAIENKRQNIILGAFGCGVFKNPPNIVSRAFKEILIDEKYRYFFDNVIFSIITSDSNIENLKSFERIFSKK